MRHPWGVFQDHSGMKGLRGVSRHYPKMKHSQEVMHKTTAKPNTPSMLCETTHITKYPLKGTISQGVFYDTCSPQKWHTARGVCESPQMKHPTGCFVKSPSPKWNTPGHVSRNHPTKRNTLGKWMYFDAAYAACGGGYSIKEMPFT